MIPKRLVPIAVVATLGTLTGCSGSDGAASTDTTTTIARADSVERRESCGDLSGPELTECQPEAFVSAVIRLASDAGDESAETIVGRGEQLCAHMTSLAAAEVVESTVRSELVVDLASSLNTSDKQVDAMLSSLGQLCPGPAAIVAMLGEADPAPVTVSATGQLGATVTVTYSLPSGLGTESDVVTLPWQQVIYVAPTDTEVTLDVVGGTGCRIEQSSGGVAESEANGDDIVRCVLELKR